MPVKNLLMVPSLLEHDLVLYMNSESKRVGLSRAKLMRMMVKYCLRPDVLNAVVSAGDPPFTTPSTKPKPKAKKA